LIVGSQAECYVLNTLQPIESDWDIMVPYCKWRSVRDVIPSNADTTKYFGWRFSAENISIDIWPDDLASYFKQAVEFKEARVYAIDFLKNITYSAKKNG